MISKTMDPSFFRKTFLVIFVLVPAILASRWEAKLDWCRTANHLLLEGDFNGDGRTDLLCHRETDSSIAFANDCGVFNGTSWQRGTGWCYGAGKELHIGDFNGDGRDDLLCHRNTNGYKWVRLANTNGDFTGSTTWDAHWPWCSHATAELHIGDFNGDGRDDMLCHDTNTGYKWILIATARGRFKSDSPTSWKYNLRWCLHGYHGAELYIGDFNGDGRDDMLCHDSTGYTWIAYANPAGNFQGGTGWEEGIGWCHHSGAELHIADSNGDGKDDLVCHDPNTGYKWVALSNSQSNFHDRTSWEADLGWCYSSLSGQFFLGDYDGDGKDDMLCHSTQTGQKWIIYAPYE